MKRIIFEGTEEQIQNLMELIRMGDNELPEIKTNCYINNLWHTEDVTDRFDCTNDEAMKVLEKALTNDYTFDTIHELIKDTAKEMGVKRK